MNQKLNLRTFFPSLVLLSLPPIAFFGARGMVPVLVFLSLGMALAHARSDAFHPPQRAFTPLVMLFLFYCTLLVASTLWAFDTLESLIKVAPTIGIAVLGLVALWSAKQISPTEARTILKVLGIVLVLFFGIYGVEALTHTQFSQQLLGQRSNWSSKGSAIFTLFLWPGLGALYLFRGKRWTWVAGILALAGLILYQLPLRGAMAALAVSALTFLILYNIPSLSRLAVMLLCLMGLTFPFLILSLHDPNTWGETLCHLPSSWQHRTHIWYNAAVHILDDPWLGWGAAPYPYLDSQEYLNLCLPQGTGKFLVPTELNTLYHPHNGFLQIWLETGFVGMGMFVFFLLLLGARIRTLFPDPYLQACAFSGMVAYGVLFGVDYNIWQSWWFATALVYFFYWRVLAQATRS